MGVKGTNQQQQHTLKCIRRLKYLSPVLTIVSLSLLLWMYKPARSTEFWSQYYQTSRPAQTREKPGVPPGCGSRFSSEKVPLVVVNGTKTLLVSAYLEHRTAAREVRVVAIVLRRENVNYHCLLCCQGQPYVSVCSRSIHSDHFGFAYGTADIMCSLPPGCETPSHITVTSAATEEKSHMFLKVQNQHVRSDSFSHNFTVCFSCMFDFTNVLQLVQSLEVLRILGVSRVVVYKTSCSPETQQLLDYYTNTGFVEVIPWSITRFVNVSRSWLPQHGPGDLHYFGQITALNDCLYRYMYQTRYMALHDVDELILPHTVDSWSELLPQLEQKHGADLCFKFENTVFPNTIFTLPPTSPSPQLPVNPWQGVTGVNILAHLRYEYSLSNKVYNFKIIINPRPVFSVTVHGVLESKKDCIWVSTSDARMHHTRAPVQPESADQLIYDGRLLDYSSRLIPSVSAVLRTAGLISEDDGG